MKKSLERIVNHPDYEELVAKLTTNVSPKDINAWLQSKYSNAAESKFILSEKSIKDFQEDYLDIYKIVRQDIIKAKQAIQTSEDVDLSVRNLTTYKTAVMKAANEELDIRQTVKRLSFVIEERIGQVFDHIQENPRDITKVDRLLMEYVETFGNILEKYYKFTEAPDAGTVINQNVSIQIVDQQVSVILECIKEVLANFDTEASMYFMELFNEKMNKLKMPEANFIKPEVRLAEAKLLNEQIIEKINEN